MFFSTTCVVICLASLYLQPHSRVLPVANGLQVFEYYNYIGDKLYISHTMCDLKIQCSDYFS